MKLTWSPALDAAIRTQMASASAASKVPPDAEVRRWLLGLRDYREHGRVLLRVVAEFVGMDWNAVREALVGGRFREFIDSGCRA